MRKSEVCSRLRNLFNETENPSHRDTLRLAWQMLEATEGEYMQSKSVGPTGDPKCPLCGNSLENRLVFHMESPAIQCAECKFLFQDASEQ